MAQGDLMTLPALKAHLGVQSSADDVLLASLITQISRAICNYLNRSFIWPKDVLDVYDGNGRRKIQLRQWPVISIASVVVEGRSIAPTAPPAPGVVSGGVGWLLEGGDEEPAGAMQSLFLRGEVFPRGLQNVWVRYRAGYQISNEAQIVPAAAPFIVSVAAPFGAYACDCGAIYASGAPLDLVPANPLQGQYTLDGQGGYGFSTADANADISLSYGYVPADLAQCALEWAADRYRYRERIGMVSKSLGGQETASYRVVAMPDFVVQALRGFMRIISN